MKRALVTLAAALAAVVWNGFWLASEVRCNCEDSWIVTTRFRDVATTSMIFLIAASVWMIVKKENCWLMSLFALLILANPFLVAMITNALLIPNGTASHVSIRWEISALF